MEKRKKTTCFVWGTGFGHFLRFPGHLLLPTSVYTWNVFKRTGKIIRIKQWILGLNILLLTHQLLKFCHICFIYMYGICMCIYLGFFSLVLNHLKISHRYHETLSSTYVRIHHLRIWTLSYITISTLKKINNNSIISNSPNYCKNVICCIFIVVKHPSQLRF